MTDYVSLARGLLEPRPDRTVDEKKVVDEVLTGLLGMLTLKPIETAPHSGVDVLLAVVKDGIVQEATVACWGYPNEYPDEDNSPCWLTLDRGFSGDEATHWMLVPMVEGED